MLWTHTDSRASQAAPAVLGLLPSTLLLPCFLTEVRASWWRGAVMSSALYGRLSPGQTAHGKHYTQL